MLNKTTVPVSVIIPTLNRPQTLGLTLKSIGTPDVVPAQIIVIDQSDRKAAREDVKRICGNFTSIMDVQYITQEIPSSTKARNRGITYASQPVIVFCDDDIAVKGDTFCKIDEIMSRPEVSMVAGIDLNEGIGQSLAGYLFGRKSYKNRNIGHVTLSLYGRFPSIEIKEEIETQWAMGFFFCVKRENLIRWEITWDEMLTSYAYAEDLDFSYSYYKKSCEESVKCILTPEVAVYHMHSKEWRVSTYKAVAMNVINREYLSYKHFKTPLSRMATRWANAGEVLLKLLRKDCPCDVIYAQIQCDLHRGELRRGHIPLGIYERRNERHLQRSGEG